MGATTGGDGLVTGWPADGTGRALSTSPNDNTSTVTRAAGGSRVLSTRRQCRRCRIQCAAVSPQYVATVAASAQRSR